VSVTRNALLVATYAYKDTGLRALTSPAHDAEALAEVLQDPAIAGFDVTMLVNEPHHVVGEAIADFYADRRRDDLALLYFTGHGVKDDDGRLYLAMTNTRREALLFTAISAEQVNDAMDACRSRRKVLVLDCCYSGAFPAGRVSKSDEGVQTLERFQGKGRAVLTASDSTQYAFEGDDVQGSGTQSLFTRYLVEAIRTGEADLDEDGDIALDELYSYVHERVVAEMPQQRPKKQEDVDGRIVIARNVHWRLPGHLQHAIESPISAQRLGAVDGLAHLHRVGNEVVRATVLEQLTVLAEDDSRSVSARALLLLQQLRGTALVDAPDDAPPAPAPAPVPAPGPAPEPARRPAPDQRARPAPDPAQRHEPHPLPHPQVETEDRAPGRAPALLLPWLVVLTGVVLVVSRLVVFEASNQYRAASVGFGTVPWLLGIGLPVLGAAVLLTAPVGERARPVVAGLLVGAAVSVIDQALTFVAYIADYGYAAGPGWWVALVALLLLLVSAVRAAPAPDSWRAPAPRADWPAVLGLVVVLGGWAVWSSRFYPDQGLWVPSLAPAVLLAVGCLPLAVLAWDDAQRWAGLTAVTVYGGYLVATQVQLIVTHSTWTDVPDAVAAIACAVVMVGACHLSQRLGGRSRPSGVPRA
jgi:hypothetical protein